MVKLSIYDKDEYEQWMKKAIECATNIIHFVKEVSEYA